MSDTIITSRLEGTTLVVETDSNRETYDSQFLVAALLIFVARGGGAIEPEETAKMLDLIQQHFQLRGAESLELLTRAMSELAEKPELGDLLAELGRSLSDADKEDIAVMALKVIAADGQRKVSEMEKFNEAVEAVGVSPEIVHRAFDRYFAETMPGDL
ncbi:MAG: TerB family tellurite resistance protein [Proteobacteria bacterium]|nr:TerB family tellurite resistance protein [Pseudomonadota bacterium]